eukprot:m.124741 g.124741  ORF g.124741 m.124741 type:complete len:99 (+) comp37853_c0_seq12:1686-1982(+)
MKKEISSLACSKRPTMEDLIGTISLQNLDVVILELTWGSFSVALKCCPAYCTRNAMSIQMLLALMELASSTIKKTFKNVLCGGVKCEVLSVLQSELLR